MKRIAIFASGSGSNAEQIANYFKEKKTAEVVLILSNKEGAFVHERAKKLNIPSVSFNRADFYENGKVEQMLEEAKADFVVLAGFLWLFPAQLVKKYQNKVVNIHPALLPNYGGKGMYGAKVHEAVIANQEKESGITIHYVNEKYDEGDIILQEKCEIDENDTPETLAGKIHELEYEYFPSTIEQVLDKG